MPIGIFIGRLVRVIRNISSVLVVTIADIFSVIAKTPIADGFITREWAYFLMFIWDL